MKKLFFVLLLGFVDLAYADICTDIRASFTARIDLVNRDMEAALAGVTDPSRAQAIRDQFGLQIAALQAQMADALAAVGCAGENPPPLPEPDPQPQPDCKTLKEACWRDVKAYRGELVRQGVKGRDLYSRVQNKIKELGCLKEDCGDTYKKKRRCRHKDGHRHEGRCRLDRGDSDRGSRGDDDDRRSDRDGGGRRDGEDRD
jgi:hypothetical protein